MYKMQDAENDGEGRVLTYVTAPPEFLKQYSSLHVTDIPSESVFCTLIVRKLGAESNILSLSFTLLPIAHLVLWYLASRS